MHELEARLSRWLLQSRDLLRSDTLSLTLGVQRSSVTLVARRVRIPFSGGPGHTEEIIAKTFHATKKGRPLGRTAWTLLKTRSADVHDPFLSLRFGQGWLAEREAEALLLSDLQTSPSEAQCARREIPMRRGVCAARFC
jgi:hypothetical protein